MQVLVMKSTISGQAHYVSFLHHQVHNTCILLNDLWLEAMLLIAGLSILIEFPQIIFFEGNNHILFIISMQSYKQKNIFTNLRTFFFIEPQIYF